MKKISNVLVDALSQLSTEAFKIPEVEYKCKNCLDRGLIFKDGVAVQCICTKQKPLQKFALFGDALKKSTFNNFDFKYYSESPNNDQSWSERESAVRAMRAAKEFVSNTVKGEKHEPPGLILIGNVGSGKTHLAAAVSNSLKELNIQVVFAVVPDLLDEMRATFNKNEDLTENDILDGAKKAGVLILDDLGAHNYTEWTRNKLFSLLNYRLAHSLPVVITTNLDMDELEEHLGERTTSRIVELCKIYRLNVHQDIRFQKNLKKY